MEGRVILGQIIHCINLNTLSVLDNGFVLIGIDGKIKATGNASDLESAKKQLNFTRLETITLKKKQILLPGFIDTHIHAPQYPNAGLGYDKPLLEWLDSYTYKLEKKYKDLELSKKVYDAVVRKTLDYGTTTACYFASLYDDSSLILANSVTKFGQRAFVGKVNMTKLAPSDYVETAQESIDNTLKFIRNVRAINNPLVQPIITPRFALSVDMDVMKKLSLIAKEYNLNIQTHISENKDEVKMVHETYNDLYASVYHTANLLTPRTVLAHGIHLSEDEMKLLHKTGTSISHCPESNVYLSSGICDVRKLWEHGINVALGTDVSGGASPSIINAMRSAISASTNLSFTKSKYTKLTYVDVFYMATLGGAKALALDNEIGNFEVGKSFDAVIVDLDIEHSSADLLSECTPQELLQKLVFLGDDRNVVKVFVNGKIVKD
ncbi:guanine deaminase [Tribolium castaneum]|uniref:Guanine deaminase n=1 Tax=Tribolium castaneum TaxID=7070 RepID=D6WQA2_TRICA|nr:PREDICTED: guanine deaminase [Tribolium castaneum]EFA06106.1 Guanine deaminase-like Protein [Tribolium castaneum]|eukprot:XP_972928.1 PREDICTED: guanine deaminase [Tribolium castaneum]